MNVLSVNFTDVNAPRLFCQSLKETGFAVLTNHPIHADTIEAAHRTWQTFFSSNTKEQYLYQKPKQDGYFPFKTENAKDRKISDLKEFFHYYPWGKVPAFAKEISARVFNDLKAFASQLLGWIEAGLPTELSAALSMPLKDMIIDSHNTLLRILHYPPITALEEGEVRAAAHEDINLITLLPAATAPGLEVKDVKGNWHAVDCDPGSIVVNVGDMLQLTTQNYYKSTTHRVTNPEGALAQQSRYSMPLFLHPNGQVFLSDGYTAQEYLNDRLKAIGIY